MADGQLDDVVCRKAVVDGDRVILYVRPLAGCSQTDQPHVRHWWYLQTCVSLLMLRTMQTAFHVEGA